MSLDIVPLASDIIEAIADLDGELQALDLRLLISFDSAEFVLPLQAAHYAEELLGLDRDVRKWCERARLVVVAEHQ
tara:strand:- start:276 stop:503 length:228 start_codon:yes stop_codon:yes gene_type:complete